jgi:hypothetical protein
MDPNGRGDALSTMYL